MCVERFCVSSCPDDGGWSYISNAMNAVLSVSRLGLIANLWSLELWRLDHHHPVSVSLCAFLARLSSPAPSLPVSLFPLCSLCLDCFRSLLNRRSNNIVTR
jgi:hypothetical protein